jgi:hypothetical protein
MTFGAFALLQRYARIDLGVRIHMAWDQVGKTVHGAIGEIEYGGDLKGTLVYMKASLTGDENDYVRDYCRRYDAFPHETTGDQFFSEEQFEAYRALGFHMVSGILGGTAKLQSSNKAPESLLSPRARGKGIKEARAMLGLKTKRR